MFIGESALQASSQNEIDPGIGSAEPTRRDMSGMTLPD